MKYRCTWIRLLCFTLLLPLGLVGCTGDEPSSDTRPATESTTEIPTEAPTDTPTAAPTQGVTEAETEAETEPSPVTLRIGSYNIATGRQVSFSMRTLGADLSKLDLDIVGVQEVDQFAARSGSIDSMKQLSKASGLSHYVFFKAIDFQGGEYGVGILSKYPILETERHELSSEGLEQRVLGRALIDVNGTHINFFVTHLSYEDTAVRAGQFCELAAHLSGNTPYILVGDFNTADYAEFDVLTGAASVNNKEHSIPTFPGTDKGIDNIVFTADAWSFTAPAVVENNHSDHYLLYASGTLQPTAAPPVGDE